MKKLRICDDCKNCPYYTEDTHKIKMTSEDLIRMKQEIKRQTEAINNIEGKK